MYRTYYVNMLIKDGCPRTVLHLLYSSRVILGQSLDYHCSIIILTPMLNNYLITQFIILNREDELVVSIIPLIGLKTKNSLSNNPQVLIQGWKLATKEKKRYTRNWAGWLKIEIAMHCIKQAHWLIITSGSHVINYIWMSFWWFKNKTGT